jgi:energy-converting hydrogenase Eha subunit C
MKPPPNPHLVLAVALLLPGMGQVLNRQPVRGLIFVCFAVLLGGFTLKTAAADVSFVGKVSGALFVWALALLDAYRAARIRRAVWDHRNAPR